MRFARTAPHRRTDRTPARFPPPRAHGRPVSICRFLRFMLRLGPFRRRFQTARLDQNGRLLRMRRSEPWTFGRSRPRCNTMRKNLQKPSLLPAPPSRHGRARKQTACADPEPVRKPALHAPRNRHETARGSIPLSRCRAALRTPRWEWGARTRSLAACRTPSL